MVSKLEKTAMYYVLGGATLWGILGLLGKELATFNGGQFATFLYVSIAVAGVYSLYGAYKNR
jgi:uncharacterized membrane protein YuzA (DUF378 family)